MKLLREFHGWTWEYVDNYMTIPRWNTICKEWLKCPPVYMSAALSAGIDLQKLEAEAAPQEEKEKTNEEKITELMRHFPVVGF